MRRCRCLKKKLAGECAECLADLRACPADYWCFVFVDADLHDDVAGVVFHGASPMSVPGWVLLVQVKGLQEMLGPKKSHLVRAVERSVQ